MKNEEIQTCACCNTAPQANKPLHDCGGCRSIKYCSRECQLAHRKEHKVDCNICKYNKLACEKFCVDQDVEDGLYDLKEDTREECPICMMGIPEETINMDVMPCCFQTICGSCRYAHAAAAKKENLEWLVRTRYDGQEFHVEVGVDGQQQWLIPRFTCPFCRAIINGSEEFSARGYARVKGKSDANICPRTLFNIATEILIVMQDAIESGQPVTQEDQKKFLEYLCRSASLGQPNALKVLSLVHMGKMEGEGFDFNKLGIPVDMKTGVLMIMASAKLGKVGCADIHKKLALNIPTKDVFPADEPSWFHEKRKLLHLRAAAFYGDKSTVSLVKKLSSLEIGTEYYKKIFHDDNVQALEALGYASFQEYAAELEYLYNSYCERVYSEEREQYNLTDQSLAVRPNDDEIFDYMEKVTNEGKEKYRVKLRVGFNYQSFIRLVWGKELSDLSEEEQNDLRQMMHTHNRKNSS